MREDGQTSGNKCDHIGQKTQVSQYKNYVESMRSRLTCHTRLDLFVDTCAVYDTAYILEYTDQVVDVTQFVDNYQPMREIPTVKAALVYADPSTGETFILCIGKVIYF